MGAAPREHILFICVFLISSSACQKTVQFPLQNCSTANFDVLIITNYKWQADCVVPREVIFFFREVQHMFQPSVGKSRNGLSLSLISYSIPNLQTIVFHQHNISMTTNNNTSQQAICTTTTYFEQPKESNVSLVVDFIRSYFAKRGDNSKEVNNVAILIFEGPNLGAAEDISVVQKNRYNQTTIRLFVILAGFNQDILKTPQIPNTLFVPAISDVKNNQLISVFICGQCKSNWFAFSEKQSQNRISCYFLDVAKDGFKNWFDGSRRCQMLGSSLASIETQQEHDLLEKKVFERLISSRKAFQDFDIFIGLRRDPDSLANRFNWRSGNPLIVSQWADGNPHNDYLQTCVVWGFRVERVNRSSNSGNESEFSEDMMTYKNGWVDVGCGVPVSYVSICEVELLRPNTDEKRSMEVKPATTDVINKAIKTGEFIKYNGKILSIPANAGNPDVFSSVQEQFGEFKLFYCDECWLHSNPLSYSQLCDRVQNCVFGGDESVCSFRNCDPSKEFQCLSGQCVSKEARCDLYNDCLDKSDELRCTECKHTRCCDGSCIPKHWPAEIDCDSCSKHTHNAYVSTTNITEEFCPFVCNRTSCIDPSQIGDGVVDCTGPEGPLDEQLGNLEKVESCHNGNREEGWSPRCVYIKDRYSGILGCKDMSHLWDCDNFVCPAGYVKCPKSYCIPLHLVQDGQRDCPLGEDEEYTQDYNCWGNFACANSLMCLHPDLVCDGSPQCPSGDDELNCHTSCASGFRCMAGTVTATNFDKRIPLASLKFVDARTRLLDLSGLNVSKAVTGPGITHLDNLLIVKFSDCKLTTADDIFSGRVSTLQSIYHFDLSYNLLKKISKNSSFRYMSNLRILDLSHNERLTTLEEKAFLVYSGKSLLERLNLQFTAIATLHSSVLQGLNNLKMLNLSYTSITALNEDSFPKNFRLQVLDLRETDIIVYGTNTFNGLRVDNHLYSESFGLCCPAIRGENISQDVCHSPQDTISSCNHLVREEVQRVLLWFVGIVAILGNITVILCRLLWQSGVIKKSYGVFVTNLGISDLIMGLYLLIIASADLYYTTKYVLSTNVWRQSLTCQVAGFLSTLSSQTSAFFTMLVTIDRYLVMKFPFGQYHFSKRGVLVATCTAWVVGFTLAVTPLLPVIRTWKVYTSNGMCLGLPLNSEQTKGWRYSVSVYIVLNTIIFVLMATGQFLIYRAMSGNRAATTAVQNSKRRVQDITVAKQLSLIVLSDFLCWFPIGLMGMLAITGHELSKNVYSWAAILVLPVNSALNPLLYTVPILQDKWRQFIAAQSKQLCQEDKNNKGYALQTTAK